MTSPANHFPKQIPPLKNLNLSAMPVEGIKKSVLPVLFLRISLDPSSKILHANKMALLYDFFGKFLNVEPVNSLG
jgi:hypothetical protein